jgi:hypothetical protein
MTDIETFFSQVLNPQSLYFPGPKPRNRRQHIGKPGTFILPFSPKNRLEQSQGIKSAVL